MIAHFFLVLVLHGGGYSSSYQVEKIPMKDLATCQIQARQFVGARVFCTKTGY